MSTIAPAFNAEDIPSRFDFRESQPRIIDMWQSGGYFHAIADPSKKPFTIVIPPPNVTGALHLGHALNNTLQDIQIRLKRMQGFNALWMPGTDHAGIATQAVVERRLREQENKTRHDLGRERLVQRIWDWKNEYETRILSQLKQMGCSCDWERTRFTLDERCARAVRTTFFDLFQKQLIYRGKRLVNWDTFLQTTVSDDEVNNETVKGHFWHFMYPVIEPRAGEPAHVVVATTRPETMLGDTAVAVHPDPAQAFDSIEKDLQAKLALATAADRDALNLELDALKERRAAMLPKLIQLRDMALAGRKLMLPLVNREIPLVTDAWAKPELGSGCVKITPAHDPNDYEVGKRCGLPKINIMNRDGSLNIEARKYQGLSMKQARTAVVEDLEALGLLERVEDRDIEMPMSDRSKTPIEPWLTDQWFVRMDSLAESAMQAVRDGRVQIFPPRYAKSYLDWLSEKRDWPVSRQLWWGHQIPVWSKACQTEFDATTLVKQIQAADDYSPSAASIQLEPSHETDPQRRALLELPYAMVHVCVRDPMPTLENELARLGLIRDEDVLDTWFSSALWPHSTLGWPEKTPELEYFYPTSTLITSRDIISLWVARMVLMSLNNLNQVPFSEVFIHPKIQDGFGETMSKSKGNGIDPLDVIDKFGADALRFGMSHLTTDTQDVRMPVQYECPHCEQLLDQTKKNRELPKIECANCKQSFSTQWAATPEDKALLRGAVTSERFEVARNFVNKLWNASRFAMLNLSGFVPAPIEESDLMIEDRWILSRLTTVAQSITQKLERYHYGEATRELYDFAWDDFCSFYLEILKERFSDPELRPQTQRLLAFTLDQLLRLLHPMMPFVSEEIWQNLAKLAPVRGYTEIAETPKCLISASWPQLPGQLHRPGIEQQFTLFKQTLGALREIRAKQNIAPRKEIQFCIRGADHVVAPLDAMSSYFKRMAAAELTQIGENVVPPSITAPFVMAEFEIFVDLAGLIDVGAETKRLENEKSKIESGISARQAKLSNDKFLANAKPEIIEREKAGLTQLEEQLKAILAALKQLSNLEP
jgi:valyl-tRNA synthetase